MNEHSWKKITDMKTIDSFILPEILKIDFFYEFKLFLAKKKGCPRLGWHKDQSCQVDGEEDLRKAAVPLIGNEDRLICLPTYRAVCTCLMSLSWYFHLIVRSLYHIQHTMWGLILVLRPSRTTCYFHRWNFPLNWTYLQIKRFIFYM